MTNGLKMMSVQELKAAFRDGDEIALLDAREELAFGARHLLMASCMPLGRVEVLAADYAPRGSARVVWCDDGEGFAARAATRMIDLGYEDVSVLDGGIAAWEAAGFRIYSGVHVPSKAFAEVIEHEAGTPWISAPDLSALIESGADIAVLDSRSFEEYNTNSIPTAISVPGAELVYRFKDLVPSSDTTVIVNCGGRTRSIIGAQSLINGGFPNKVVSLKDGTMAWHLAGCEVVQGATRRPPNVSSAGAQAAQTAAETVAQRFAIARIDAKTLQNWRDESDRRTLYVLDVRTPEEYEAGHLPGARSAPGGQLVQETDNYLATWGARVVLIDDDRVRATMTASWLKQMGWDDVSVLTMQDAPGERARGRHQPRALGLERAQVDMISASELQKKLAAGSHTIIDLEYSKPYKKGHIPGAWFATRTRLTDAIAKIPGLKAVALTSPDGALARLAAADLAADGSVPVVALDGGTQAWAAAGHPLEAGDAHMADIADDVWLPARELGANREEAMREYLAWEIELVNQMASDDDHRFQIAAG